MTDPDERWIARALQLAAEADYATSPNPMVGAVVLDSSQQPVAEGFHQRAYEAHGEIVALRQAGERARGGTLYVNLEPCVHQGRTPPCVAAVLDSGVRRVVVSMVDPNPLVNGAGIERLRESGIEVTVGPGEARARRLNEFFVRWVTSGRPFVTVKFAMSLDGKIATVAGESRWISGEEARVHAHRSRHAHDAVMVGLNTVIADDPQLTVRLGPGQFRQPLRVVLDSRLRIPLTAALLQPALAAGTLIACTEGVDRERREAIAATGAEVAVLPDHCGHVDLASLLDLLGRRQLISLMVEGGGEVHASLLERGLVDKVEAYLAPLIIGGRTAPSPVGGSGFAKLRDAVDLDDMEVERLGQDLVVSGYVHGHS